MVLVFMQGGGRAGHDLLNLEIAIGLHVNAIFKPKILITSYDVKQYFCIVNPLEFDIELHHTNLFWIICVNNGLFHERVHTKPLLIGWLGQAVLPVT